MTELAAAPVRTLLRRLPKQDRSRERVDEILNVAMRLIGEKGIDAVTMKEVARLSGGPIASVYQYFPNKSAIIATLYERYNQQVAFLVGEAMAGLDNIGRLHRGIDLLLDRYYAMMKENPALLDLVNAVHADKSLQHEDLEQTERIVDEFYDASHHLMPRIAHAQYRRTLFLLFQLASAAVRMALAMKPDEGSAMVREFAGVVHLQIERMTA